MIVYAIFFCMTGGCRMFDTPRLDTLGPMRGTPFYQSLASCEHAILGYAPPHHDAQGRYMIGPNMWYECRHRHIDTWQ